jgi:hypothetical protein
MGCKSSFSCIYFHFLVNFRLGSTSCTYNRLCVPFFMFCTANHVFTLSQYVVPQKTLRNHKRCEFDSHSGNTTLFSFAHFSPAAGSADDFHLFLLNTVNILSMFGFKFNMLALMVPKGTDMLFCFLILDSSVAGFATNSSSRRYKIKDYEIYRKYSSNLWAPSVLTYWI